MNGESLDLTAQNIARLKELFPEILTDGNKIDFDMLKTVLGEVLETEQERYQFTWHGKKRMIKGAQKPSKGTLRPVREKSKDFDTTENLYIEGDNLEVLKLLQKSYNGKIKMIYIDPPYNTGKDFVYKDNFKDSVQNYLDQTGQMDADGNVLSTNTERNGRFHTDWLNMIYARIKVAKNLLKDDGVAFISIGEAELSNLKKICEEIFGELNVVGLINRVMKTGGNKGRFFSPNMDYIIVCAKNIDKLEPFKGELDSDLEKKLYNKVETIGPKKGEKYRAFGLYQSSLDSRPNQRYYIECPDGSLVIPPGETFPTIKSDGEKVLPNKDDGCWRWSQERYLEEKSNNNILFIESPTKVLIDSEGNKSKWNVYTKIWLNDRKEEGQTPTNILDKFENRHSAKELKSLSIEFDFPKPVGLIKFLMSIINTQNEIVLDFFSGSATTAHAMIQLNAEDGGNRKFIMVQLPELLDEKSETYKDGYRTICDIGEERIRRAGEKIKDELKEKQQKVGMLEENIIDPDSLDIGFKVLKLDTSNIREWNVDFVNLENELDLYETPFIDGRSELDIVYEIMLKQGLELTYPIETFEVNGKAIYDIAFGSLFICLSQEITTDVAKAIIARRDEHSTETSSVIFSDAGFSNDSDKLNCIEILKDAGYPEDNLLTI